MALQTILNVFGSVIGIGGALLMYYFTSKEDSRTFLYQRDELIDIGKKDKFKNNMIRNGMLLLFLGFLFQLAALFV